MDEQFIATCNILGKDGTIGPEIKVPAGGAECMYNGKDVYFWDPDETVKIKERMPLAAVNNDW